MNPPEPGSFFPESFTPAPGQGCLAVEARQDDARTLGLLAALTHGYRTALLSSDPKIHGLIDAAPHIAGIPILINVPAFAITLTMYILISLVTSFFVNVANRRLRLVER